MAKVFAEVGKTTAENGYLIAATLQDRHQSVGTLGDGHVLGDVLHDAGIEAFEQSHALGEAFLEVDLAAHSPFGNGLHLLADACARGQLVDTFGLNERRVHIEANQATHAAVHIVTLEGEVYLLFRSQVHELRLHLLAIVGRPAQREFDARAHVALGVLDAHSARQAQDRIDVQSLPGDNLRGGGDLLGRERAPDDGQNEAVFALPVHPRLVFFIGDGQETDVHIQLFGLEEQFFHHLPRVHVADTDKDTE